MNKPNRQDLFTDGQQVGERLTLTISRVFKLEFAWCPHGSFMMGTSSQIKLPPYALNERSEHSVTLTQGYWIAKYPMREVEYRSVTQKNSPYFNQFGNSELNAPACGISWIEAKEVCTTITQLLHKIGVLKGQECIDLPTEAQWEYACRAGTGDQLWYFGNDIANLDDYAWYKNNTGNRLHPVGLKLPNPWGIHDLYGNIDEWVLDDYGHYGAKPTERIDPYGTLFPWNEKGKVIRGGSFDTQGFLCRTASRRWADINNDDGERTGIRLVCVSKPISL